MNMEIKMIPVSKMFPKVSTQSDFSRGEICFNASAGVSLWAIFSGKQAQCLLLLLVVWEIENLINIKVFSSNTSSWTNMRSVRLGTLIQKYQILEKLLLVKGYFCVFLLCVWWILNEWVCANNILIFSWDELLLSKNI